VAGPVSLARNMGNLFYPYANFDEAKEYLCRYADQAEGPWCGVTYGANGKICLIRKPSGVFAKWLHVIRHEYLPPKRPPPPKAKNWMESGWDIYNTWYSAEAESVPAFRNAYSRWAISHPITAGAISVAGDIFGLVLVVGFVTGTSGLGAVALASSALAFGGNAILLGTDGAYLYSDITGDNSARDLVNSVPNIDAVRTWATVAILIDFPISSWRSLTDLRALRAEAAVTRAAAARAPATARYAANQAWHASHRQQPGAFRMASRAADNAKRLAFQAKLQKHQLRFNFVRDMLLVPPSTLYTESGLLLKDADQLRRERDQTAGYRVEAAKTLEMPEYTMQVFFSTNERTGFAR